MHRTVLITGCSSGIGLALAQAFLKNGDHVIATARKVATMEVLRKAGCEVLPLDVTDAQSRTDLLAALEQQHDHIDLFINNAGISAMGPIVEIPEDTLQSQFATNVIAPVMMVQVLLPLLRAAKKPVIVNVGSISGVLTTPFAGAYCASKAALHSLSQAMLMELAPFGIEVITVQPGAIKSNFGQSAEQGVKAWLTESSLYHGIKDGILARAGASQQNATPAKQFAETLIKKLASHQGTTFNIGRGSQLYPFIARWLPEQPRARLLSRRFGLNRLVVKP